MKLRLRPSTTDARLRINVIIVAVFSIILVLTLGWYLRGELVNSMRSKTDLMFATVYDAVNKEFQEILDTSRNMSANTFLINALLQEEQTEPERFHAELSQYLSTMSDLGDWSTMYVVSDQTMKYYLPDGSIKVLDPEHDNWDCWYTLLADSTDEYHVDVDVDLHNTGAWTIFVDTRIVDENNKTLGVSGVGMDINRVLQIAEHYTSSYGAKVSFVSADGSVRIGAGDAKITAAKRNVASEENTEPVSEMVEGTYTISEYLPLIGWYVVLESSYDTINDATLGFVVISVILLLLSLATIAIANTRLFSKEKQTLAQRVITDPLTGLLNRAGLEQQIAAQLDSMADSSTLAGCFLMVDLDHFKDVNDSFGHEVGDEVLREFATLLRQQLRDTDILGRLGGDEFVAFLPSLDNVKVIERKARDLHNRCRVTRTREDGVTVVVTMSTGIARSPEQGRTYKELYHLADAALYKAKKNGRDGFQLA